MFHFSDLEPPPGATSSIRAWMNPGMDAPCLAIRAPAPDLRLHMEYHKAFQLHVAGTYDDLAFLAPCADLITTLRLDSARVNDASALATLKQLRTLDKPPANADAMLPALPRLRHLMLGGQHAFEVLAHCGQLRELSVGIAALDPLLPDAEPSIASLLELPALQRLQMLSLGGASLRSLAGIDRFTDLRTLQLAHVLLRETTGHEFLAERFGFDGIESLIARSKSDERRLSRLTTRLVADDSAIRTAPVVDTQSSPTVSHAHPACIIILLDRSGSTEQPVGLDIRIVVDAGAKKTTDRYGKGPDADKRHCDAYTDAINRFLDRLWGRVPEAAHNHVHVGLIEFGARVDWAWSGTLKGRAIVPVADLHSNPLRSAPARVWLDPVAAGETPLGEAMELAQVAVSEWLAKHPDASPPVVISVSSGKWTGDDLRRHACGIRRLSTPNGPALLLHIVRENMYGLPYFGVEGYKFSEECELFAHASPLPPHIADAVRAAQYAFHEPLRGYFDGAAEADVENLLHSFTALPGIDWSADLIRHPLPPYRVPEKELAFWPWHPPGAPRKAKDWKPPRVKGPMTEDLFWRLIDQSRKGIEEAEEQLDRLPLLLDQLDEKDLIMWQRILLTKIDQAYRWDLWAVAFIAKGGCSDDAFEYFRAWLVAQGRKYFEASLAKPEAAAKRIEPGDQAELEGLLSVADGAYESKAKRDDLFEQANVTWRRNPAGEEWDEDDLPRLFPKLAKKYD